MEGSLPIPAASAQVAERSLQTSANVLSATDRALIILRFRYVNLGATTEMRAEELKSTHFVPPM